MSQKTRKVTGSYNRLCCLYTKHKVVEWRDGCVFKTKKIDEAWFPWGKGPKCNVHDENEEFWCPTMREEPRGEWMEVVP